MSDSSPHTLLPAALLEPVGHDLNRPECVLAMASGDVFVPDWRGGVTRIGANGSQETWLADTTIELRPNGIALAPDGSFLLANLGADGGVWRLQRDGRLTPFLVEIGNSPLPPANFVTIDSRRRVWISISTRRRPRQHAWRPEIADGFIVLADGTGARIVADGLHYTNEVRPDPSGTWLYAAETFGRRLSRFPLADDGGLGPRETVVDFGRGCFPDGFEFDDAGRIWLTSLVSNRLLRIDGTKVETVLEDTNPEYVDDVERAFAEGSMNQDHLGAIPGTRLQQLTSVAFGGPDRRTVLLGSLHSRCLYQFRLT